MSQIDAALNVSGPPEKPPNRRNSNSGKDTVEPTPKKPRQEKSTRSEKKEKKEKEKQEKKDKGRKEDKGQEDPKRRRKST